MATRAGEFTAEKTEGWTDEQLETEVGRCFDDPEALDQLMHLIDCRQAADDMVDASSRSQHSRAWAAAENDQVWGEPTRARELGRPTRRLSPDEAVRVEFESYLDCQWMQAEHDCKGQLLNARSREAGMDPRTLFQGPLARATKHASEELLSWWGAHGRLNFAAFRHQALGRDSDSSAAAAVRRETFDMAPTWGSAA